MPGQNPYIENAERWKALSSIDYFTQFVKAWISFNAWYKNSYPDLSTDKDIIEEIKQPGNRFRDKLVSLIEGQGTDCIEMKSFVSGLHYQLERKYIYKRTGERVTFMNIVIEDNPNTIEEITNRGVKYKCERTPNNWKEISLSIYNRGNVQIFSMQQNSGYDLNELENDTAFISLGSAMQLNIKSCYEEINPYRPVNLLSDNQQDSIRIGNYDFVNDSDKIAKAIITILYLLRNALFHGEIVPDADTQNVYEPAYHILRALVESL